MKKIKYLGILLAGLGLALSACTPSNGGGSYDGGGDGHQGEGGGGDPVNPPAQNSTLVDNILDWLETRGVTTFDSLSALEFIKEADILATDSSDEFFEYDPYAGTEYEGIMVMTIPPYYQVAIKGDVTATLQTGFKAMNWTVIYDDEEGSYSATDPSEVLLSSFFADEDEEISEDPFTYINFFTVKDYEEAMGEGEEGLDGDPKELISEFLVCRDAAIDNIPYIYDLKAEDVLYMEAYEESLFNAAFFILQIDGFVCEDILDAFVEAKWDVPSSPSEYGYECVDPTYTVEVDVLEDEDEGYTEVYIYAYADLFGGDDEPEEYTGLPKDGVAAFLEAREVKATAIPYVDSLKADDPVYMEYLYEGLYSYPYFAIYVQNVTVSEILAYFNEANWDVPNSPSEYGYECVNPAKTVEVDVCEDELESDDGYLDVVSIVIYAYADLYGEEGEDEGPTEEEGDANVVDNQDGTFTAHIDFSGFNDGSVYPGQSVGEVTVGVVMDTNQQNKPTYYSNGSSLRIYWGTGLSFTANEGHEIVDVKFTCTTGNDKTFDVNDSNLKVTGGTYSVSEKDVTITANSGVDALQFVINATKGNVAITNISVTYK